MPGVQPVAQILLVPLGPQPLTLMTTTGSPWKCPLNLVQFPDALFLRVLFSKTQLLSWLQLQPFKIFTLFHLQSGLFTELWAYLLQF